MSALSKTQKNKAIELIGQAEATLNKKVFSLFGGAAAAKERNAEDAAEIYLQAANAYKVGGLSQEAGETYMLVGSLYRDKCSNPGEAAKAYSQAGQCFKKSSPSDAVKAFESAISLLTDGGRLSQAAKLCKECAEMYESDEIAPSNGGKTNTVLAIEMYEQAAELFDMEASNSQASSCQAKIAELCSAALEPPDLLRASNIYDSLGRKCLESNLLKFNAKTHFLHAIMCLLAAADSVGANNLYNRYEGIDYTFNDSREGKFSKQLIDCVDQYDSEGLATTCYEYDRISKLDPWKTTILMKVKRTISDDNGGSGGGGGGGGGDDDDFDLT